MAVTIQKKKEMAFIGALKKHEKWAMDVFVQTDHCCELVRDYTGRMLSDSQMIVLAVLIRDFGFELVVEALTRAMMQYDTTTDEGFDWAISKVGGICFNMTHITCLDCKNFLGYEGPSADGGDPVGIICEHVGPGNMSMYKTCKTCDHYEPGTNGFRWS